MIDKSTISRRQGAAFNNDEISKAEILGLNGQQKQPGEKTKTKVNTTAVLDMIKSLQDEIKVAISFQYIT